MSMRQRSGAFSGMSLVVEVNASAGIPEAATSSRLATRQRRAQPPPGFGSVLAFVCGFTIEPPLEPEDYHQLNLPCGPLLAVVVLPASPDVLQTRVHARHRREDDVGREPVRQVIGVGGLEIEILDVDDAPDEG